MSKRIVEAIDNLATAMGGPGSDSPVMIVRLSEDQGGNMVLDKTCNEIYTAMAAGKMCILVELHENFCLHDIIGGASIDPDPEGFCGVLVFSLNNGGTSTEFSADTPDSYPVHGK